MRWDPASIAPALADECGYTGCNPTAPFGTASEATVVPDPLAIDLPASVTDQLGATLGIPGITAHRAVFADGPVAGRTVLVHGVLGAVARLRRRSRRGAARR
jgi:NADPH2:quinone reductase